MLKVLSISDAGAFLIDGGYDYDGAVIAELETKENEPRITELAQHTEAQGIKCIAITGKTSDAARPGAACGWRRCCSADSAPTSAATRT